MEKGKLRKLDSFNVVLLGVIFDPKRKKILIGRRVKDQRVPKLTWAFPGEALNLGEDLHSGIKQKLKQQTGLVVENLGLIFSRVLPERKELVLSYFLCEVIGGKEKAGEYFEELKWVSPEDVEKHFTTSFHPHLKEYILNLK